MTKPRNYAKFGGVMMGHEEKSENTIFLPATGAVKEKTGSVQEIENGEQKSNDKRCGDGPPGYVRQMTL
jgi:hypothetical protein